jgi:hypothetical protein
MALDLRYLVGDRTAFQLQAQSVIEIARNTFRRFPAELE